MRMREQERVVLTGWSYSRRIYRLGPLTLVPGDHQLVFHPAEAPTVAGDVIDNGDRRPLSFAIGTWNWALEGEQP